MKGQMKILKFRSFTSKQEQGFVLVTNHIIPQIVLQDILCQLFAPIFQNMPCPDVYYFSSTDQILTYKDINRLNDYIYVHFLPRTKHHQDKQMSKFKILDLDRLAQGVKFDGKNIYVFSEKCYSMYGSEKFCEMVKKKIYTIKNVLSKKQKLYTQAFNELNSLNNNQQFVELKEEIQFTMEDYTQKLNRIESIANRYARAKTTLNGILSASGIQIRELRDLY